MAEWVWESEERRYRNVDTGRFVGQNTIRAMQNRLIAAQEAEVAALAQRVIAEEIGVDVFVREMRTKIRTTSTAQYLLGRGGRQAMTPGDWSSLGGLLKPQYRYLQRFAEQINAGGMTAQQVADRAQLYIESTRTMRDHGMARAWGIRLPAYPKEGTACAVGCKCHWSISQTKKEIRAYWKTNSSQSCDICMDRRDRYNPYVVKKPT